VTLSYDYGDPPLLVSETLRLLCDRHGVASGLTYCLGLC
jgi:hypothetical protein